MLAVTDVVGSIVSDATVAGIATRAEAVAVEGGMTRWRVTISCDGRSMVTTQYGGVPRANYIVDALAEDVTQGRLSALDTFGDDGVGFALWERTVGSVQRVFGSIDRFLSLADADRLVAA